VLTKVSVAVATPDAFDLSSTDWSSLCLGRHNILLEGPRADTDAILAELMPSLRIPVTTRRAGRRRLKIPAGTTGALVIRDVAMLSSLDQGHLMRWLGEPGGRHVISTTEEPLFPYVARGEFNEGLYYRLNVVLLRAGGTSELPDALSEDHERPLTEDAAPAL
jgi:hypothetical protein